MAGTQNNPSPSFSNTLYFATFFQSWFSALLALVDRHKPQASVGGESHCQGHWARGESKAVPACCLRSVLPPSQVDPYLPYEYTCEGMLERIHAYIQHQVGNRSCPPWGTIPDFP